MKRHDINWMNKTTVTKKPPSNTATIKTTTPVNSMDMNQKGNQMIASSLITSCTEPLDKLSRYKTRKEVATTTQYNSTNMIEEDSDEDDILNKNVPNDVKIKAIENAHTILSKSKTKSIS